MKDVINLTNSTRSKIAFIDEGMAASEIRHSDKKWSFSNVYYFTEFRDVYLALSKFKFGKFPRNFKKEFTKFCLSVNLPFVKSPWKERRILEYLNAFKNLSLVNEKYEVTKEIFVGREIGQPLSQSDIETLKQIYFGYFRFKEFFSWLIRPPINPDVSFVVGLTPERIYKESKPIYFFSSKSGKENRFTDNFIYELEENSRIYYIDESDGKLSRFWDVFITWGKNLNIIEKFSFRFPLIRTSINKDKSIGCCYVVNEIFPELDLLDYLNSNYNHSYIYLPFLVLDIALKYRVRVERVQEFIIEQYKKYREVFSLERTSEIFIKKGKISENDKILFPIYNDAYISHLIIRK